MVLNQLENVQITENIVELDNNYIDEIYNLIWLVMPGYYRKKSFEMGSFYGIVKDDKLVAIAGQRMESNLFIEISGVVTHPNYTRKGFARQLVAHNTTEILAQQKTPILHTTKGNPAISLYKSLGYEITRDMNWWFYQKV